MGKLEKINYVLKDQKRKNLLQIIIESIHAGIIEKEIPFYYFYNLLHKEDANDYKNFVGMKTRNNILDNFYTDHQEEFTDKIMFNNILTSHDIPTPKILAHSQNYKIQIDSEEMNITTEKELENIIKQCIINSSTQSIFVKPLDGAGGAHAFKYDENSVLADELSCMFNLMENNNFIFQETIIRNDKMSQIYPHSINTLRIYTHKNNNTHEIETILALLRVGSKGSIVDNGSMFVALDIHDEWTLRGDAKSFLENGGESFSRHPDTNFEFDGFKIPYQSEIINILKKTAPLLPRNYIGWDVGISEKGPVIIEANDRPHVIMTQIMAGGFKGHSKLKKILKGYI